MSTENLTYALRELLRAEAEESAGRENYDGGSWGYHGHYLITATAEAAAKFETALNAVIDARVNAVLTAREAERENP